MTDLPAVPPDDTTPAEAAQAAEAAWSTYYEKNNRCRKAFIAGYLSAAPLIAARAAAAEREACIEQIRGLRTHPTWQTDRWAYQAVIDLLAAAPEDTP